MTELPLLFDKADLPLHPLTPEKNFKSLQYPVWSEDKAKLIQEYLRLFTFITKHGIYIDGFSAPQQRSMAEICSARLVMETEPKRIKTFWLCDLDPKGIELLRAIAGADKTPKRRIEIREGDFNLVLPEILASGCITSKTATFALLDQRTLECSWQTVQALSRYKSTLDPQATKIEIFYFFATGWLDRSIAAVSRPQTTAKLESWWGRPDWRQLQGMQGVPRAKMLADRFKSELGYKYAHPYAIHSRRRHGRTMYHMIHATDHAEAPLLMLRAYRKISGRPEIDPASTQVDMAELWRDVQ